MLCKLYALVDWREVFFSSRPMSTALCCSLSLCIAIYWRNYYCHLLLFAISIIVIVR